MRAARLIMLVGFVAIVAGLTGPATAGASVLAPTELTAPSYPPDPHGDMEAVSCWAANQCVGVGDYENAAGAFVGVIETISGSSVTATAAPLPPGASASIPGVIFSSVSCPSAGSCVAVGSYRDSNSNPQGLLLSLSGGTWTASELQLPATAPANANASLQAVSCSSAGNCAAVGSWHNASNDNRLLTVESTASGSGAPVWGQAKQVTLPAGALSPEVSNGMQGVYCASAGNCVAIGYYASTTGSKSLAVKESGGIWGTATSISAPTGNGGQSLHLNQLACTSAATCTAAGSYFDNSGNEGAVVSEVGGVWPSTATEVVLPANSAASGQQVSVESVGCSTSSCSVVGAYQDNQSHIDAFGTIGATAYPITLPAHAGTGSSYLWGVGCSGATCFALGSYTDQSGVPQMMSTQLTGAVWQPASQVGVPADASSDPLFAGFLGAPSCLASQCEAVGFYGDSNGYYQPLIDSGNNGTWGQAVKPPLPPGAGVVTKLVNAPAISCVSNGNCAAAGTFGPSHLRPGLLNETGGSVSTLRVPLPVDAEAGNSGSLAAVKCVAAGDCVAVGNYTRNVSGVGTTTSALVLSSSGGSWGNVFTPVLPANAVAAQQGSLSGVSCSSAGNCVAVGHYTTSSGQVGLLVDESGGSWGRGVAAPALNGASTPGTGATSVSCVTGGSCAASGWSFDSASNLQPVVFSQDAAGNWTVTQIAVPSGAARPIGNSQIVCPASGACTAVWQYQDSSGNLQLMLANESGGTWASATKLALPSDAAGNPNAQIGALSCPAAGACALVGYYSDSSAAVHAFSVEENGGSWGTTNEVTAPAGASGVTGAALFGVSCISAGNCVAVGRYSENGTTQLPLLEIEANGSWANATVPAVQNSSSTVTILQGVSCVPTGGCSITGQDSGGYGVFMNITAPSSLTLGGAPASGQAGTGIPIGSLSAAFGSSTPAGGTVTFKVFGPSATPPSSCSSGGTVVGSAGVSGHSPVSPTGSFVPSAAGDYWWFASYGGDTLDDPSATACGAGMPETVVAAAGTPPPASPSARITKVKAKGDTVKVTVSCSGAPCAIKLALIVPGKKRKHHKVKTITLATASGQISAGASKTFTLTLKGASARLLASSHKLKATLTLMMGKSKSTKQVTLAAPKPKKKRH